MESLSKMFKTNLEKPYRKRKYLSMDNTKIGIKRGNAYQKNEVVSRGEAHKYLSEKF